ncbi:hypothetical protein DYB26_004633 [Aphanomyces astaci]|uniref:Protein kinase domain-containing protein n=3 Tax=Aphanomyces astaci TaxID=112090 RepID=A0A397EMN0_APHAT|nr:hypothetical protein DYB31_008190 [Aphanomyces astaci]RHY90162.1 hypothetical protein DYB26_004633 [Aphanomyces astaci]
MFGVGLAVGGGVFCYIGHKIKASSSRALRDIQIILESRDIASIPATPSHERHTEYVSFSGRLKSFDSPLLKSAIMRRMNSDVHDAIRLTSTTYQRAEEAAGHVLLHTETKVSESEAGGIVAVEPFTATSTKVLLKDSVYFRSLYRAGEDEFKPSVDSSISIFSESAKSKTIGFRTSERLIPVDQVVSGVGLVEGRLVPGATGAPKLEWVLVHPDLVHDRPALVVYGDKSDLVRRRKREAGQLDDIGDVFSVLGAVGVVAPTTTMEKLSSPKLMMSPTATWKRQKKFTPTRPIVASPQPMKTRRRRHCTSLLFSPDPDATAAKKPRCDSCTPTTEHEDNGEEGMTGFTSSSKIEDVGLFNCDHDVQFTGGLYGEGTDGKVSACIVQGQKIALKRSKPHEGFTADQAKRKSAVELHYLRRVRHKPGFIQCLGMCDGIEHTCIALEVMDCKLSDYQRKRMGVKQPFPAPVAHRILKQIAAAMMILHEEVDAAHGDLACRNILVRMPPKGLEGTIDPEIKLSDFGRIKTRDQEPPILKSSFSFFKNADVGSFGRDVLYRLLVGDILPAQSLESRSLHRLLQDYVVKSVPDAAAAALGPYRSLFDKCTAWGVRPTFRAIHDHMEALEYFEVFENGLFPLKPNLHHLNASSSTSSSAMLSTPDIKRSLSFQRGSSSCSKKHDAAPSPLPPLPAKPDQPPPSDSKVNWLKPRPVPSTAVVPLKQGNPGTSRRSLKILNEISKQRYLKQ